MKIRITFHMQNGQEIHTPAMPVTGDELSQTREWFKDQMREDKPGYIEVEKHLAKFIDTEVEYVVNLKHVSAVRFTYVD